MSQFASHQRLPVFGLRYLKRLAIHFSVALLLSLSFQLSAEPLVQAEWHYTYRPSDTLQDVGKRLLNSSHNWSDIVRYNQIDNVAGLLPGSILKIPINWLKFQPKPASTLSVSGNVLIKKGPAASFTRLKANIAIQVSDEVLTRNGRALIKFADDSILIIDQHSHVTFNKLTHFGETGMVDTRIRLKRGSVSTDVAPLVKGSHYEITTPSAVAAVRGTQFRLHTDTSGTRIEVTEGEVSLRHAHGEQKVKAGQGLSVNKQSAIVQGKILPPAPTRNFNDKVISDLPAELTWQEQINAASYEFQLRKDSKYGELVRSSRLSEPSVLLDQLQNGSYSLAMRAIDSHGFEGLDDESELKVQIAIDQATLLQPLDGSVADRETVQFSWQLRDDATLSRLELSADASFKQIVSQSDYHSDTHSSLPSPLEPGQYFWRVRALGDNNAESTSDSQRLTLRGMMDTVTILSVNYVENQVGLFWNNVATAKGYILQVSDKPNFATILREEVITKPSAFLKLSSNKPYYARVKAMASPLYDSTYGPSKMLLIDNN